MIWRNLEPKCVSLQTSENLSNEIKMWETESHDNYLLKVCLQAVIWDVRIFLWLYNGLQAAKRFYQAENYIKRPVRSLASGADNTQQWFHPLWASVITVAQAGKPNFLNIFTRCWRDDPVSRQSTCQQDEFFCCFFLSKVARCDSWSTNGRFCAVEKKSIFRNTQVSSIFSAGLGHNKAALWKMTEYKRTWNRGWTEKETSPSQ